MSTFIETNCNTSNTNGNTSENINKRPNILLTGGSGYIGSHTCIVLLNAGYDITVVDNNVNSSGESLKRVCNDIVKCDLHRIRFFHADLRNSDALEVVFRTSPTFYGVIHFAGLKAVGESVAQPLKYYGRFCVLFYIYMCTYILICITT